MNKSTLALRFGLTALFVTISPELAVKKVVAQCLSNEGLKASVEREAGINPCELRTSNRITAYQVSGNSVSKEESNSFQLGSRVVLCATTSSDLYVSIWDMPPKGKIERLFPNSISHPSNEKAALFKGGQKQCAGIPGSGYKIVISEYEESGKGYFYFMATKNYDIHPDTSDFALRDWQTSMKASIEKEGPLENQEAAPIFPRAVDAWLTYTVRK